MTKLCKFCDAEYDIDSDHWYIYKTGRLKCKMKIRKESATWRANNREHANEKARQNYMKNKEYMHHYHRSRKYGIDEEEFESLLESQNYKCAICGTSDWKGRHGSPHVDHDHNTGVVRGILCSRCNRGIGFFNDNEKLLLMAAKYINMRKLMVQ